MLGFGPLGSTPLGDDGGSGVTGYSGNGAATLSALTASATGTLGYTGTAAATLSALTTSGTGTIAYTGTGAATLSALTAAATGTFKKKTGGSGGGTTPDTAGAGEKYATKFTMPEDGTISSLILESQQSKTVNTRMALYADNAGVPGARLSYTPDKASVVSGENFYDLNSAYFAISGTVLWVALHTDASINWLLGSAAGGSYKNADTFSDGIANPFGTGTLLGTKAPLVAVYYEGLVQDGFGDLTLSELTASATGKQGYAGTAAATLSALTASATGTLGYTGTGAATLAQVTVFAVGGDIFIGPGVATLSSLTAEATGTFVAPITGTAEATLSELTAAGTGSLASEDTGVRRFGFLGGGDARKPRLVAEPRKPFKQPPEQDLAKIWPEKDPQVIRRGTGVAVLDGLSASGGGAVGRVALARATMFAIEGSADGEFYDTVAMDNEFLLLAA